MPNLEKEEHLQTQSHQFLVDSKILVFRGCKFFVGSLNQLKKGWNTGKNEVSCDNEGFKDVFCCLS